MRDIVIISYKSVNFVFHDNHAEPALDKKQTNIYIPVAISQDDSIRELKQKIFKYCDKDFMSQFNIQPVIDEMYFYISTKNALHLKKYYFFLKELENIDAHLESFDITDKETGQFKERLVKVIKTDYTYNTIAKVFNGYSSISICQFKPLSINIAGTSVSFKPSQMVPLGKTSNRDALLIMDINPHTIRLAEQGLKLDTKSTPKMYTIYLELARDQTDEMIKPYFPLLDIQEIASVDDLKGMETTLYANNIEELNGIYNKQEGIIDYLRNIPLSYDFVKEGYNVFQYKITPRQTVKVKLDTLFKLLETSEQFPLSRINYGKTHDKLYRLYTKEQTLQGENIPFIDKSFINRIKKLSGRANMITIYSSVEILGEKVPLYLDINEDCHIIISTETKNVLLQGQMIASILIDTVTPVIKMLENYLKNGGYDYDVVTYFEPHLVKNADYKGILSLKNPLKLDKIKTCLHPFFYIISDSMKKSIMLLYKRTSGFLMNDDSAIDYYLYQMVSLGIDNKNVITFLIENFGISKEDAAKKFAVFKSNLDVMGDEGHKHQKKYSGIFIYIKHIPSSNDIEVNIKDITNVKLLPYIKTIILATIEIALNGNQTTLKSICTDKVSLTAMRQMNINNDILESAPTPLQASMEGGGIFEDIDSDSDDSDDSDDRVSPKKAISSASSDSLINIEDYDSPRGVEQDANVLDDISSDEDAEPSPVSPAKPDKKDIKTDKKDIKKDIKTDKKDIKKDIKTPVVEKYEINRDKDSLVGNSFDLFHKKLKSKEPALFVTENGPGKFNSYSRTCPSNVKRQPILLTNEEKMRIDKEAGNAYDGAIEYGTTPENKNWYICPRYWCLLNDVPLTQEDVDAGKCGGKVIPHNAKKVPKDAFIYEFYAKSEHDNNGKYITHYPHLLDSSKHRDGYCAPCCFKQKEGKAVIERDIKCKAEEAARHDKLKIKMQMNDKTEERTPIPASPKGLNAKKDLLIKQSILGGDKTPLPQNRVGFLQPSLEIFMNVIHSSYFVKGTTNKIKPVDKHIMRIGVENNIKQSFLSALAIIYSLYYENETIIPSIKEFKELLVGEKGIVNISNFMTFQNGALFTTFVGKRNKDPQISLRNAFENFKKFILDDNSDIDYTYLWDIIVEKNGLFKTSNNKYASDSIHNGMNLVILEISENDGTSDVNIICPTTIYSNSKFSSFKKTIIIVKHGEFYEPICFYSEKGKHLTLNVAFSKNDHDPGTKKTGMLKLLEGFKQLASSCLSLPSTAVHMKRNVGIQQLIKLIFSHNENYKKKTLKQIDENLKLVLNYNKKIIGVQTNIQLGAAPKQSVFIPCYASTHRIIEHFESITIDEAFKTPPEILITIEILNVLHNHLNNHHPNEKLNTKMRKDFGIINQDGDERDGFNSLPIRIVTSQSMDSIDKIAIGILTNANQFIRTRPIPLTELPHNISLEYHDGSDYYEFDRAISEDSIDTHSYNMVKNIRLETIFYNLYRHTFKALLNEPASYEFKSILYKLLLDGNINATNKAAIKDLINQGVEFIDVIELDNITIANLDQLSSCFNTNTCPTNGLCKKGDELCKQLLPRINLVNSQTDNEDSYLDRLIDELLRYKRIRNYIFTEDAYLAISDTEFKLHSNEYLIYESELDQSKLNDLKSHERKHKLQKNISELTQPAKVTQKYKQLFLHGEHF